MLYTLSKEVELDGKKGTGATYSFCEEVGVVKSPSPFRRSTQGCYGPQGSGRNAGGNAGG